MPRTIIRARERGQSIIEVVIVAFFVVTALVTLTSLTMISISRNRVAKERAVATRLAQEAMEWIRFERDRLGFDSVESMVGPSRVMCLDDLPTPVPADPYTSGFIVAEVGACPADLRIQIGEVFYTRTMTITGVGGDLNIVTTVAWQTGQTETTINLQGKLTQWQR